MIKQAIILAAGNGSRIQKKGKPLSKPLQKVAGLSLIKRSILTAKKAGVERFVIITGFRGEDVVAALQKDSSLGVQLTFVQNDQWKKSNGVSLLCAKNEAEEQFLLMMSDHIFTPDAVHKMALAPLQQSALFLGIDQNLAEIFDPEDATKVQVEDQKILKIGKDLREYNACDTGIFACRKDIFNKLEAIFAEKGDLSLSEGVRALAAEGQAHTIDLSGHFWQDVDTQVALKHAEKQLLKSMIKPTDGWISRHINRKISLWVTKYLIRTNLSPDHVTGLVSLIGILSGFFVATGHYTEIFIGGLFFNLASILDGCDGEIARLTFTSSKRGEWLDTISDNITHFAFLIGVSVGYYQQVPELWVKIEGISMLSGLALMLGLMFYYAIRYSNSGSLLVIQKELNYQEKKEPSTSPMSLILKKIKFMMKRDFFAMLFMFLCWINQLQVILVLSLLGVHITWVIVLRLIISTRRMKLLPQSSHLG